MFSQIFSHFLYQGCFPNVCLFGILSLTSTLCLSCRVFLFTCKSVFTLHACFLFRDYLILVLFTSSLTYGLWFPICSVFHATSNQTHLFMMITLYITQTPHRSSQISHLVFDTGLTKPFVWHPIF